MNSPALLWLLQLTGAASVAVVFIAVLRVPLRRAVGARAAYWLWLMVPASAAAVLLPAPSALPGVTPGTAPDPLSHPVAGCLAMLTRATTLQSYTTPALVVWGAGAAVMLALAARRQRAFVRSLGKLQARPDGAYQSTAIAEPMVVGLRRPRVVLPADFESRYTREERALVLAHERAHLHRRDSLVNAAATAWLCLFWFNPLMYWAVARLRFDQELACDAEALATSGAHRRSYAGALLKAQLVAEAFGAVPAGCHWRAGHPLKQRVTVLKRPLPGSLRHASGVAAALVLIASGSYAVWAADPAAPAAEGVRAPIAAVPVPDERGAGRTGLAATADSGLSAGAAPEPPATPTARPAPAPSAHKAAARMCPKARARANARLNQNST